MADLPIQEVVEAGAAPTFTAVAAAGDAVLNLDGNIILYFKNVNVAARAVTVTAQDTSEKVPGFGDMTKADVVLVVPALTGEIVAGPFPRRAFNDALGKLQLTYNAETDLTVAVLKVPAAG